MNILFISPHPGFGGASTANENMASIMASLGHSVTYMDEYRTEDQENNSLVTYDSFPIHSNKLFHRLETKRYFNRNKFDIIFIGVPIIALYYYRLFAKLKNNGTKICFVYHSLSLSKGIRAIIDESLIAFASKNATHNLFVSEFTKLSWQKYSNIKTSNSFVIYNAIAQVSRQTGMGSTKKEETRVSFVGRLSEEKNPELFCQVAKHLTKLNHSFSFVIWGDGPLEERLKEMYSEYVQFRGFEPNKETIYDNTDILLLTSMFENCPMVILEAASYCIPCIAPAVGGIPEIVQNENNGILYNRHSISDVDKAIMTLLNNYHLFSQNAYVSSQKFSFETMKRIWAKTLNSIYNG